MTGELRPTLRIGGWIVRDWASYAIDVDMLLEADQFSLELPGPTRELYELCAPDAEVQVLLGETVILSGFIDDRVTSGSREAGLRIQVTGRDRAGRLVDDAMPLVDLAGLTIKQLAERICGIGDKNLPEPWIPEVRLSNAENRLLFRGYKKIDLRGLREASAPRVAPFYGYRALPPLARASKEPAIVTDGEEAKSRRKVEPGETRWQVLAWFLEKAKLLAWTTGDGKALVVGLPNYDQEPQYRFFAPAEGSSRAREGNVLRWSIADSVGERYQKVVAYGMPKDDFLSDEPRRPAFRTEATSTAKAPVPVFRRPKTLVIVDDGVQNRRQSLRRAERELAERDATGHQVELTVQGHGHLVDGRVPVIYAPDTMATVEIEELGLKGEYLLTSVRFEKSRQGGEQTQLRLVPKGTVLS